MTHKDRTQQIERRIVEAAEQAVAAVVAGAAADVSELHALVDELHMAKKAPLCNFCGLTCALSDPEATSSDAYGLIEARVDGGYASTPGNGHGALDDITSYTFSLCEFCLDWIFERCAIPPATASYVGDADPFRPARVRVRDDDWRSQKTTFFEEKARRDEARASAAEATVHPASRKRPAPGYEGQLVRCSVHVIPGARCWHFQGHAGLHEDEQWAEHRGTKGGVTWK